MPWQIPFEYEVCELDGATVRCTACDSTWTTPNTDEGGAGEPWCATCDADTMIVVVEGGPGSEKPAWRRMPPRPDTAWLRDTDQG